MLKRSASIPLREDGSLRLAVVADTQSHPHPATLGHLAALQPDAILHGGDIGDLGVLADLEKVAPVFAVRGNIDVHAPSLPDVLCLDLGSGERSLRILLTHIAVAGPRLRAEVANMAREESAAMVVCGHSHVPFIGRDRGLTVFNPGSAGPRRGYLPIVFGTLELGSSGVRLAHVDCQTGQPWSPP